MTRYSFHLKLGALLLCLFAPVFANADNIPDSFKFNGEYINPACVEQLQTYLSENNGIIVQAVVLDTCQDSNLAYQGNARYNPLVIREASSDPGVTYIGYAADSGDPRADFGYEHLGVTSTGLHILSIENTLSAYRIQKKRLIYDIDETREVSTLEKIASFGFFPCRESLHIEGESVVLRSRYFTGVNVVENRCVGGVEEYDLGQLLRAIFNINWN